jgi:hypothetical protein
MDLQVNLSEMAIDAKLATMQEETKTVKVKQK